MKRCPVCTNVYSGQVCPKCAAQFALKTTVPNPPEEDPLLQPKQLFHGLEIVRLLGRGGMGVVYQARQQALDRFVALKILPKKLATDPGFQVRFTREAKALASLSHPNIVTIHDFGQENGQFFLVMEFVDGVTLRQVMSGGKLAPEAALRIVPQLCDALEYAHGEGVVHRDIKPENIMIDKKGRVKIADFGLAKLVGTDTVAPLLTQTNVVMGTPNYMAPEQIENPKGVDHRADIYSLGVVFYEMLTGELPLGRFQVPSKKVQLDVRLDEVVLKTLEKEPERRYQSAGHVKNDITRMTTVDSQVPTMVPTPPPRKTNTALVVVAVVAIVALPAVVLGAIALLLVSARHRRQMEAERARVAAREREEALRTREEPADWKSVLSDAASVDAPTWRKIRSGTEVESGSLTALLLRPNGDLEVRDASKLHEMIERAGRISILQPEYVLSVDFRPEGESGTGLCTFEAPGVYRGRVEFSARHLAGRWTVTAFEGPRSGLRTQRQRDGTWAEVRRTTPTEDLGKVCFRFEETPDYWEKGNLSRNPLMAKAMEEIDELLGYAAHKGISNLSRNEIRQGYLAAWVNMTLLALDSPEAKRIEREFYARPYPRNRWSFRRGDFIVLALAPYAESRSEFVVLVSRIQAKLELPAVEPDLPFEHLQLDKGDLTHGWEVSDRLVHWVLPLRGTNLAVKEQVLTGMRHVASVAPESVRTVYFSAFKKKGAPSPTIAAIGLEFQEEAEAAKIAVAAGGVQGWLGSIRTEVLRSRKMLLLLYLLTRDVGGGEEMVRIFRLRMGLPKVDFDQFLPTATELPEGYGIEKVETLTDEIVRLVEMPGLEVRHVSRARLVTLKPQGRIVLLEIKDEKIQPLVRAHLLRPDSFSHLYGNWVYAVQGPPELQEVVKKRLEPEKF